MVDTLRDHSYWNATAEAPAFSRLATDVSVDIAIIGGGIVGVTTARMLKDQGLRVAVIEARRVGRQVTGKSTAKVTSQHGLLYQTLERKFDEPRARLYAEAQEEAIRRMRRYAEDHELRCDMETRCAYVYTRDEEQVQRIEREAQVARKLGLPATLVRETGLPFDVLAALRYDGQAQFHPTRYVAGLAWTLPGNGCHVFENSRALSWEPDRVVTEQGSVKARHVVMATHLPLGQIGGYYAQAHPYAEPVIAARIRHAPADMYLNAEEPSYSLRTHTRDNGDVYAIVAGTGFKPGHTDEERSAFEDIERWLATHFDAGPVEHRWVNEDYTAMDQAPYIGWSSSGDDAYLVATGFAAWGITNGTVAGMILTDLCLGRDNSWLPIFDASRVKPVAGGVRFLQENIEVAGHLARGYLSRRPKSFDELAAGEAAIMHVDGDYVAAYRDEHGRVHAVSAICSHMGCIVGWNETDRTWDCPCHGSRFECDGTVVHGPATMPLGSKITG